MRKTVSHSRRRDHVLDKSRKMRVMRRFCLLRMLPAGEQRQFSVPCFAFAESS